MGYVKKKSNKISVLRAVVVFLNQNIGVGLLSIPYCFQTGVVLNSVVLMILAFLGISSFILLVDVSITTGKSIDYAKFMRLCFERNFDWFPLTIISITLFGCAILHFQYACTMIQTFFDELTNEDGSKKIPDWCYNRWFLICAPAFVLDLPLMFLRSIKALSYASLFTIVLICAYIVHTVYNFGVQIKSDGGFDINHEMVLFSFNQYFIPSLSIQAFAYTFNMMVAPTIEKLKAPTRKRQYLTFSIVIIFSCFTYILCGVLPYFTLFSNIQHEIVFEDFYKGRPFTILMKVLFGVFLIMTTPLILYSCRVAFNDATFRSEFTAIRWNIMGVVILALAAIIAVTVKSITTVFGFIGGVTCTMAAYVLPSIYYLRICKKESLPKTILSWFMLPMGIVIMCVCLYDSIRSLVV
ncbi:Transmembrane amino acid transporter protein [Tritrichomonas foetus]|uniref:Transmembrane amino acid transporter protein n=1 Tax=Tritrichomonas foetus TaxID=1144522 RepID=A0A1J4JK82_9EUKA|nr:Transmembrane amino acid transporter protein [Tritrichomonas foetus]|eukprot:OHS97973.1 Transmembrane amino acid transporter protein [Tritrichomonas foetus]